jgi:hypothetical protein
MGEDEYTRALKESRPFYRRQLAASLARIQLREIGGCDPELVVRRADQITQALVALEEHELAGAVDAVGRRDP